MRKLTLSILFVVILASLTACGGKDKPDETKPTLEVIEPTETTEAETLSDKLDETKTLVIPTIGTKEVEKEVEVTDEAGETTTETVKETVGIVETLAPEPEVSTSSADESNEVEALQPDVIVDSNNNVGVEAGHVDVSEELTEEQTVVMDTMC